MTEPAAAPTILLTVAICTHNRAGPLTVVLESLRGAKAPDAGWETLVVLNACTDGSAEVARTAGSGLPLRVVDEPNPGVSHARNRAVAEARGEWLIFIDDDARVAPDFLTAYAAAFRRWPDTVLFGGPITPVFEPGGAGWATPSLPAFGNVFGLRRSPGAGLPIRPPHLPFGVNYAVRAAAQRRHPYDPALGRAPVGWVRNHEETDVMKALLAAGGEGRWADARVEHVIPAERQTTQYVWSYYEGNGRLHVLRGGQPSSALPLRVALAHLRYRLLRMIARPEVWARALINAAVRRGEWKGLRDLSRGRTRPVAKQAIVR